MKCLILATTLIYCSAASAAPVATAFSFASVQWGESIDQVETHLRASGLAFESSAEKTLCKVRRHCTLTFDGQVSGNATFDKSGLIEVVIFSAPGTASDRLAKLIKQYGAPRVNPPTAPGPGFITRMDTGSHWLSPAGESIDLNTGTIRYTSAAANQQRAAQHPEIKF